MKRKLLFATGNVLPNNGSGYFPQDIRRLYTIPGDLDGTGQTIGILEFSNGYSMRDALSFWSLHGIVPPQVDFVSVDGTRNDNGTSPDDEEASLDLQWAGAIAPKAKIVVYEANAGSSYQSFSDAMIATLQYILQDKTYNPSVLSISYGDAETNIGQQAMAQISDLIQQLSAGGVTVCISSGDQGAYGMHDLRGPHVSHADAPATAPYAVAVGGTSLQPDGSETAWTFNGPSNGGATGGGFSSFFPRPSYQSSIGGPSRGIPDLAMNADPATGYQIIFQGKPAVVGGTSVSCPVFAAIVALANQRRSAVGLSAIANLTSLLYAQPAAAGYRDITSGNNSFNGVKGYQAVPGWDACTGWGALDATKFINFLAGQKDSVPTGSSVGSAQHPVVHLQAVIKQVELDQNIHGVHHHHLLIESIHLLKTQGTVPQNLGNEVFIAIRYGDHLGLPGPIPGLKAGQQIELQGEYIDKNHVYPSIGNPGDPVIHYTHHPIGFVIYEGNKYQ
ncbi:MAG: kumamolysin-As precursor-like protein [Bacilli bacterium]|nr:kumamolysin-As precursor-like protein [Bacilli bacterium]